MKVKCCLISIMVLGTIFCLSIDGIAKDKDLVFFMSFDKMNGDKIEDDSGNGSLGVLKGNSKIVNNGKYKSALSLDGQSYVDCGNAEILNQAFPGLTMEAWIKPEVLAGIQAVAVKWAWTVPGDHIGIFLNETKSLIAVADGVTSEQGYTGTVDLKTGEWVHIAATWNSKDFSHDIYVNGKLDSHGNQTGKGLNTKSTETLKIGAQITGTQRYFTGLVDDVAIYGRILTEAEIKKDMGGMTPVESSGKLSSTWAGLKKVTSDE